MTRKRTKEQIEKMRKETKAKNEGLVCKIGEEITIMADQYQFILNIKGRTTSYYPTIEMIMKELMEYKEKEFMIASDEKTLLSTQKSIQKAREWLEEVVKPLFR